MGKLSIPSSCVSAVRFGWIDLNNSSHIPAYLKVCGFSVFALILGHLHGSRALGRPRGPTAAGSGTYKPLKCLVLCIWHPELPPLCSPHLGSTFKPMCKLSIWPKLRKLSPETSWLVTLLQQRTTQTSQKSGAKTRTQGKVQRSTPTKTSTMMRNKSMFLKFEGKRDG